MATQSYTTPGSYTFTLPVSTGITIRIAGASGGSGGFDACPFNENVNGGAGGNGRYAEFTLTDYTYGELTINVGGAGGNGLNVGQTDFAGGDGGTNGGGRGGDDKPQGSSGGGGGGGGYSSISYNGNQIVIAGGGGGGGGGSFCNYGGPVRPGFTYEGGDAESFSSTTSSISVTNGENGYNPPFFEGDGGGVGGGGGGAPGGLAGPAPTEALLAGAAGFDQNLSAAPASCAAGGLGGGSTYRSDILTLSSQSTNTGNGYVEIEYTAVSFDTSAATVSKAGPYYTTAGTEMKFSALRRDFRAQQPKTTSGGSETFSTDNAPISASELLRNTNVNETNPIVPQCQDNLQISSSSNWKISQFRNSIKYFYLTQDSSKTTLNYILHGQPWENNLPLNIVKTFFLEGTCGSISSTDAALQLDADVYNLNLIITGSVLGSGGSAGTETENGGDGGDAIYIDTNGTGTVTIRTSGASAQVYGGGGGGGGGGDGEQGADGSGSYTVTEAKGRGYCDRRGSGKSCDDTCRDCFGGSAYCGGNQGNGDPCCGGGQRTPSECFCCFVNETRTVNYTITGGAGGDGADGGRGAGYLQTRQLGGTGGSGIAVSGAGTGGDGGNGGDGGTYGQPGDPGEDGDPTPRSGSPASGTLGGTAGRAVAGSGYVIDIVNGVDGAYLGLK